MSERPGRKASAAAPRTPRSWRRRLGVTAGLAAVAITGVMLEQRLTAPIVLPLPKIPAVAETQVGWEDFVGAEACGSCHQPEYQAWRASTHGRAGGAPSREIVIARFNGVAMRFKDATVTPRVTARGEYQFTVSQPARADVVFAVAGVIGGGHMVGGGTQGFVARFPDGTIRFLPFDFIRRESVWFCNTIGRGERGWVPITPDLPLEACVDWPPQRVLGTHSRFSNCQECHGSQIQLQYDSVAKGWETRYRDLRINCESCHGPGRRHVDLARAGGLDSAPDIGLRSLATLTKDQSLAVCFQCHALKDVLAQGYLPGESLLAHYSLGLSALGDKPWHADGRVRTFAYQENHRFSDCYLNGSMTCVDCHDPHSQQYRDIWDRPLSGRVADGQCTDCHASKAENVSAHTHHKAGTTGSQCVACHMPYFQHPGPGKALRFTRSDHTVGIPRPAFDVMEGIDGACRQCHRDQTVAQLDQVARSWWGEIKPLAPLVQALAQLTDSTPFAIAASQLLRPDLHHPLAQVEALGELLDRYLRPDMSGLDGETTARLERLAGSADLDVKAIALATLDFAAGDRRGVRRFLARTLGQLGDQESLVRARWKLVLGFLGDSYRTRGEDRTALVAYQRALELGPADAAVLGNMGLAFARAGDWGNAVAAYRHSLALDPWRPLTPVNLGLALEARGDVAGAAAAYQQALAIDPHEAVGLLNLGNLYLRQGNAERAIALYRQAIQSNVSVAPAHFNLARVYAASGQIAQAKAEVEWGLAFEPGNRDGAELLAQLQRVQTK